MKKNIQIGKDVIEILTDGMYDDSRFIYREYVQNAADQIDIAEKTGLLAKGDGVIDIRIDYGKRNISISDNATGIPKDKVFESLGNIAASTKDSKTQKGFRGIGRLGGLGYCQLLTFETSYKGEPYKSIMKWDAQRLRDHLKDPKIKMGAAEVIDDVTTLDVIPCNADDHFFKVELFHINDANEALLNQNDIKEYLSMVAPVPFQASDFYLCRKIYDYVKNESFALDEYVIRVNGDQIYKGYKQGIHQVSGVSGPLVRVDEIKDIEVIRFYNDKGELLAWGWFGLSCFEKQIPERGNPHRGIRLRKANIQIGSESALLKLHKEQRGNYYFVGEIHAIHNNLRPNSRRDYFNENITLKELEHKVKSFFYDKLYPLYCNANEMKNCFKRLAEEQDVAHEIKEKTEITGFSSESERTSFNEKYEKAKQKAEESRKILQKYENKIQSNSLLEKVFKQISECHKPQEIIIDLKKAEQEKPLKKFRADKLTRLPKEQRKLLGRVFDVINRVLPQAAAEGLIIQIEEEFK